jgi:hypothetical protein
MNNLTDQQLTTLWLGSFRYHCGRTSYAVSDFCEMLIQEWETIPENCQNLIKRDLEEAFARDDRARADSESLSLRALGHDCDRAEWEQVRKLWEVPQ